MGLRVAVQPAFADSFEWLETVTPAETQSLGFGVGNGAHAAQRITWIESEREDVTEQRASDTEPLGVPVPTESREPQDREGVGGQAPLENRRWRSVAANMKAALDPIDALFEARFETE